MPQNMATMEVSLGDGLAVIRRDRSSHAVVARILGVEAADGKETVYLDRRIHDDGQNWQEWEATGAISTILTRRLPAST